VTAQNVDLVRQSFEAFARGDFETAFAAHHPDVQWCTAVDEPDQHTYRGVPELMRFVESIADAWENRFAPSMEYEDFIDCGDWVVVPWHAQLKGRGSGISIQVRETYAVQVEGGKIVQVDEYRRPEDALAAVKSRD
jgi:ketosteroid isomerase-like protein